MKQSKPVPAAANAAKRRNLFDADEGDDFPVKKPAAKPAAKSKNLFGDEGEDDFPVPKSKPSGKNKKKLFDDSDWSMWMITQISFEKVAEVTVGLDI